jgi:hypothetical protein
MWYPGTPAAEQCEGWHALQRAGPRAVLPPFARRHVRDVLLRPL